MDRYALAAELTALAGDCLPDRGRCQYDLFVGLGAPPRECSYISTRWEGASKVYNGMDRCYVTIEESFVIELNNCCLVADDENGQFNSQAEDSNALCFLDDFGAVFDCMLCKAEEIIGAYSVTCDRLSISSADVDPTLMGFCYAGQIRITFERIRNCCAPPPPPEPEEPEEPVEPEGPDEEEGNP